MNHSWPRPGGSRPTSADPSDAEECWEPCQQSNGRPMYGQVKHKRNRYAFTTKQLTFLENVFSKGPYVDGTQRYNIATRLGLSEKCVKVWFQNRRMKEKYMSRGLEDYDEYCNDYTGSTSCPSIMPIPSSHEQEQHPLSHPMMSLPIIDPDQTPYQDVSRTQVTPSYRSLPSLDMSSPDRELREQPNSVRLNYYQDISPVRDEMPSTMTMHTTRQPVRSNTSTSNSDYTSSAEYSIDMCKRYKDMVDSYNRNETVTSGPIVQHNQPSTSYSEQSVIDLTKTEPLDSLKIEPQDTPEIEPPFVIAPQEAPEDLSMKKTNVITQNHYHSAGILNYVEPSNSSALPIYVNYSQPFATDGNVTWNQVIIPPAIPAIPHNNVKPAARISIVPKASASKPKNYYVPKSKCNCCRCPKKNRPPETKINTSGSPYVIKVLYPQYN